jgi:hypothetical protein
MRDFNKKIKNEKYDNIETDIEKNEGKYLIFGGWKPF